MKLNPLVASLTLCILLIVPFFASADSISEFAIPTSSSSSSFIASDNNGNLWFTQTDSNKIGKITESTGVFTEYALPNSSSGPLGITLGPDGAIWFTERDGDRIGRINSSGTITEFALSPGTEPYHITSDISRNLLWFTLHGSDQIAKITLDGAITYYNIPGSGSMPTGIAVRNGEIWFSKEGTNYIGRFLTNNTFTEYSLVASTSLPSHMIVDKDDIIWFTMPGTGRIGKFSPTIPSQRANINFSGNLDSDSTPISLAAINALGVPIAGSGGNSTSVEFSDIQALSVFSFYFHTQDSLGKIHQLQASFFKTDTNVFVCRIYGHSEDFGETVTGYPRQISTSSQTAASGTVTLNFSSSGIRVGSMIPDVILVPPWSNGSSQSKQIYLSFIDFTSTANSSNITFYEGDVFSEYELISPSSGITSITSGPSGSAMWATLASLNTIVEFNSKGVILKQLPVPTPSSNPFGICTSTEGNIWFIEKASNKLAKITINNLLGITSTTLPSATLDISYSTSLVAIGGTAPYTFSLANYSGNQLPPGLEIANNGVISGTPATAGIFSFLISISDSVGRVIEQTLTINCQDPTPPTATDIVLRLRLSKKSKDRFLATVRILNRSGTISEPTATEVYASQNKSIDGRDVLLKLLNFPTLASGKSSTKSFLIHKNSFKGRRYIAGCANCDRTMLEQSYSNNNSYTIRKHFK